MFFDGMNGTKAELRARYEEGLALLESPDDALTDKQRARRWMKRSRRQDEFVYQLISALACRNAALKAKQEQR